VIIQLGDVSVDAYFREIESIVTLLNDLGSPMSNDDVAIHRLSEKFAQVMGIIAHRVPFPDLATMRSMVITEEMRLNWKSQSSVSNTSSSAHMALLAENSTSRSQDVRSSRDARPNSRPFEPQMCGNFSRDFYRR
nr:hybrid signal transduction histidine kinase M [Tanacetum cinerariifolium]